MISIVCALHCEALPLINALSLRRDHSHSGKEVFRRDSYQLIISGVGKVRSAIATTYLLTAGDRSETSAIFNIGIAGSNAEIGSLRFIHKIKDAASSRTFFPDLLINHGCPESTLVTYDTPRTTSDPRTFGEECVDMEGSGFFEAAAMVLPPSRIALIKVISDALSRARPSKEFVSSIIGAQCDRIVEIMRGYLNAGSYRTSPMTVQEEALVQKIVRQLRLTRYQGEDLARWVRSYRARFERTPEVLERFTTVSITTKQQGKERLHELRALLS